MYTSRKFGSLMTDKLASKVSVILPRDDPRSPLEKFVICFAVAMGMIICIMLGFMVRQLYWTPCRRRRTVWRDIGPRTPRWPTPDVITRVPGVLLPGHSSPDRLRISNLPSIRLDLRRGSESAVLPSQAPDLGLGNFQKNQKTNGQTNIGLDSVAYTVSGDHSFANGVPGHITAGHS